MFFVNQICWSENERFAVAMCHAQECITAHAQECITAHALSSKSEHPLTQNPGYATGVCSKVVTTTARVRWSPTLKILS